MVDVNVNFVLRQEEPVRANFEVQPDVTYTAEIVTTEIASKHNILDNRDYPDQHPMSAITGLEDALEGLSDDITAENNRAVEAEETLDNKIDSEADTRADEITRVEGLISDEENRAKGVEQDLASSIDSNHQAISNHVSDKNNPHEVTKAQVGLGNVENLAPANMPMSTATKTYVDNADNGLQGQITTINTTIGGYGNIVTHNVSEFATASQGALADTALQPNDNISELTNNLNYQTATQVANSIAVETSNRESADNGLQSQIDAIVSSSDVFDIVGTYAELQAYDISTVPVNDIIKVLVDSTHAGAATYYRCVENNNVKSWSYIGSEGAYYTKAEADNKFVPQTRTVNNKALSSDITLTATDVGALPSSTVIPTVNDATVTIQKNGSTVSTFTLNQSSNETVNITVPTKTSEITNDSGYITSASLPTVNNGQLDIQVNGSSIATFTANQSGNTAANIVVPDSATWGNITGDIADQTDLQTALDDKQDKLTAGTDLEIVVGSGSSNTVSGTNSIILSNASANSLSSVIVYGKCSQTGTPTTSNPIDIVCNNGAIKYNTSTSSFYTDGTVETVTDSLNNTAIAEMLLGFGDYIDTQDLLGVGGTRKVGLMVLTGTEEFNTTTLTNCYSLESALGDGNLTDRTVYCTHFQHASTLPAAGSRQGYALIGNRNTPSNSYTVGFGATTQFSTVALFKSWLATQYANGTPVIIAYPLATPTIFGATTQTLNTKSGSNQLTITQSAINNLNIKATYTTDSTSTINFTNESGYITGINSTDVTTALGYTPVNPSSLANVATSGDYDDLTNKPTIPTVNNSTITFTQGGVTKGSFTLNQSSGATIALDAGGAGGIQNTATGTDSLTILGNPASDDFFINIGSGSGINVTATEEEILCPASIAIGVQDNSLGGAEVGGEHAIAIGTGTNAEENGIAIGYASQSGTIGVAVGVSSSASNNGVAVGGGASASGASAVAIGTSSNALSSNSISIGNNSLSQVNRYATNGIGINGKVTGTTRARANNSIGIGGNVTNVQNAIQLGSGTNTTANSLQVGSYSLLDTSTGLIPIDRVSNLLEAIYPVGSVYIGTQSTCPMSTVMSGTTWTLVSSGKALWTGDGTNGNTTINAGLPNITGSIALYDVAQAQSVANGAFTLDTTAGNGDYTGTNSYTRKHFKANFSASSSNSIYGNSTTVQPPAYVVNVWRRTA